MLRPATYNGNAVLLALMTFSDRIPVETREGPPKVSAPFDPASMLLTNALGDGIIPCAMYRYETANANFPVTSGNVIQVSPLMEKIAYEQTVVQTTTNTVIVDPFVTCTSSSDASHNYLYLWLLDTQPQISGARYKYVLVRFKANHEVDQLIPSNEVDVP